MKNLLIRTLTGLVFVIVTIGCLLLSQYTFIALFLFFIFAGLHEFYQFFNRTPIVPARVPAFLSSLIIFILFILISSGALSEKYYITLIPLLLFLFISELYRHTEKPFENIGASIFSVIYITIPFSLTNILVTNNVQEYDPTLLIALFVIIWIYDSGAYLFGVSIGKNRLFERISPKKSWEGAIGGALSALVASYFLSDFAPVIPKTHWMILTLLIVVSATFGDLTESLLKRQFDLKDSSSLLPGHGGILDRFDSLLFAAPVMVVYIKLFL
ncbi:phosphatidate cytidylyltransferase [Sunxiuqinia sp. A32]|uniref:phosphatidate cytidylyltransferase n=1 Tax=Sunxiuqinia sp. A32 TaxID=3461496 RepID=UPI0040452B6A